MKQNPINTKGLALKVGSIIKLIIKIKISRKIVTRALADRDLREINSMLAKRTDERNTNIQNIGNMPATRAMSSSRLCAASTDLMPPNG